MFKTSRRTESTIQSGKGGVGIDDDNRAKCDGWYKFNRSKVDSGKGGDNKNNEVEKKG